MPSRRTFLKALSLGATLSPFMLKAKSTSPPTPRLKVGLIGCGGRGLGALRQVLLSDENICLWALGDVFPQKVQYANKLFSKAFSGKVSLEDSRCFVGLDAYQKVLESGVDIVLLTAPPGFRPQHFEAAVHARVHIFAEKPIAVDMAGVHRIQQALIKAQNNELSIQHGFCWRYSPPLQRAYGEIIRGKWGKVLALSGCFLAAPPRPMLPLNARKKNESDVAWQLRNWMSFNWLSGGGLVEQAIHAIDKMSWALNNAHPLSAVSLGGRTQPENKGNYFDHYGVRYTFTNQIFGDIFARQWERCYQEISDTIICQKARMQGPHCPTFISPDGEILNQGASSADFDMYQREQIAFLQSIRKHQPLHTEHFTQSTTIALMGRMAADTGRLVTWEEITANREDLSNEDALHLNSPHSPHPLPIPGN